MSKLVYSPQNDFFVHVNLVNLEASINEENFEIELNEAKIQRIISYLEDSKECNIICFPEFSFNQELQKIYRDFSDENDCIIIGGSGLESIGNNQFYAFCPLFFPGQEDEKVYKKFITIEEKAYSKNRLVEYPNPTNRDFKIINQEIEYNISVYICYDFLQERYNNRTDIVFIPQLEGSPRHFINRANEIVQGFDNFVLGVNNHKGNLRSMGFANLNSSLIRAFSKFKIRKEKYLEEDLTYLSEHHTVVYDLKEEKNLKFKLNLAKPVPKPYNFSYQNYEPNISLLA